MKKVEKLKKVESLLKEASENIGSVVASEEEPEQKLSGSFIEEYRQVLNDTADKFGVELDAELEEDDSLDSVFSEWSDHVNMSASDLREWSKNPCSREASQKPVTVMKRNLRLLEKNKDEWTDNDVEDAKRTISFISRMKAQRPDEPREGPHGCPSEWAISLLNWAYNPFDSVPSPSSEVKEDLDPVDEVTLQDNESYEFSPVPDQVLYSDRQDAMQRARNLGLEGVHEHVLVSEDEEVTYYMPGDTHRDWVERVKAVPENEEMSRSSKQVFHADQERHKENIEDGSQSDDSVDVPPVAICQVDEDEVEMEEDVEKVLDKLWDENQE